MEDKTIIITLSAILFGSIFLIMYIYPEAFDGDDDFGI